MEKLKLVAAAGGAIGRFMPLIETAISLIKDIINIYETAEYNQNICEALVGRVKLAENAIDTLKRRRQKNESKFRNDEYYKAFNRFIYVLEEIKKFTADISNIHGFRKFTDAYFVKEKFQKLTNNYDTAMRDLQFTMAVANEEQRRIDAEALEEDLAEMSKNIVNMRNDILENNNKVNIIHDIVIHMMSKDKPSYDANKIDPKDLDSPTRGKSDDKRGKDPNVVIRKIYKGQEVACKRISEEMKNIEILMKLSECKHILGFYGITTIDDYNAMVFEWAERGTLKQLYEQKYIPWHYKVRIALKICRGLIFLQCANILHHDLKCENILITETLDPKIYNFELARYTSGNTTPLNDIMMKNVVPWMAPEKLDNSRYTAQCEIFSFGILLWELAFEKTPYQGWEVEKIKDHISKGGREKIIFGSTTPEISQLQEEYKKIINDTWKHDPQERISFMKLLDILEELYSSIRHMFENNPSDKVHDKPLDLDGSEETSDAELELPDEDINSVQAISLEEGIQAFIDKKHQKAWECFDFHAENNNTTAKYWKGRYLWEGHLDGIKEREEGKELLKEAADEGNSDAQLRYAFTLVNVLDKDDNRKIFMNYLTKSATEGNATAQYNLGDIYVKGKQQVPKDENEGIKWLRKAALQDNKKATNLLIQLGKDVYDI